MAKQAPTILVVDPESDIRGFLHTFLKSRKYHVICASDEPSGLVKLKEHHPDLLILDALLPRQEKERLLAGAPSTPVLYISAIPLKTLLYRDKRQRRPPVDDIDISMAFVEKPIQGDELIQRIHGLLH